MSFVHRRDLCVLALFIVLRSLQAGRKIIEALPSSLGLNFSFIDLDAGFECFKKTGAALPDKTVEVLKQECDGALFGAVRCVQILSSATETFESTEE